MTTDTLTAAELGARLDDLRAEIDVLTDAAYALSFDTDREVASAAGGIHEHLNDIKKNASLRAGLLSRLRAPE